MCVCVGTGEVVVGAGGREGPRHPEQRHTLAREQLLARHVLQHPPSVLV